MTSCTATDYAGCADLNEAGRVELVVLVEALEDLRLFPIMFQPPDTSPLTAQELLQFPSAALLRGTSWMVPCRRAANL